MLFLYLLDHFIQEIKILFLAVILYPNYILIKIKHKLHIEDSHHIKIQPRLFMPILLQ
jgi:hypothetical protein